MRCHELCLATASLCALHRALAAAPAATACVNASSPSTSDHREVDAVAPLELVVAVDRDAPQVGIRAAAPRSRARARARAQSPQPAPS